MDKKLRGGIDSIVALVILVGLVIVGIVVAVIPIINQGENLSETATGAMSDLQGVIVNEEI